MSNRATTPRRFYQPWQRRRPLERGSPWQVDVTAAVAASLCKGKACNDVIPLSSLRSSCSALYIDRFCFITTWIRPGCGLVFQILWCAVCIPNSWGPFTRPVRKASPSYLHPYNVVNWPVDSTFASTADSICVKNTCQTPVDCEVRPIVRTYDAEFTEKHVLPVWWRARVLNVL